jgi:hypothetical protein
MPPKQAITSTMRRNVAKKVTRNAKLQDGSYPILIASPNKKSAPSGACAGNEAKPTTHLVFVEADPHRSPSRLVEPSPTTDGPRAFHGNGPKVTKEVAAPGRTLLSEIKSLDSVGNSAIRLASRA